VTLKDFEKLYYEIGDAVDMLRYNSAEKWFIVMHPDTVKGIDKAIKRFVSALHGLDVVEDTRYELGEFVFKVKDLEQ
jgi:hypothetical protein